MRYVVLWFLAVAVVSGVGLFAAGIIQFAQSPGSQWVLGLAAAAVIIATIVTALDYLSDRNAKPEL